MQTQQTTTLEKVSGLGSLDASIRVLKVFDKPVFNDAGEVIEQVKWVRYQTTSQSAGGTTIEDKLNHLLQIGDNDDPSHLATNTLKARAASIMEQINAIGQDGTTVPVGHIALDEWVKQGAITEVQCYALKHHEIYSVQQLRGMTESKAASIPSGINPLQLRERARAYLMSHGDATMAQALAEMKGQNDRLQMLLEQALDALAGKQDAGDGEAPKKGGRKPMPRDADGNIIREAETIAA
jgi:hypothetical protein